MKESERRDRQKPLAALTKLGRGLVPGGALVGAKIKLPPSALASVLVKLPPAAPMAPGAGLGAGPRPRILAKLERIGLAEEDVWRVFGDTTMIDLLKWVDLKNAEERVKAYKKALALLPSREEEELVSKALVAAESACAGHQAAVDRLQLGRARGRLERLGRQGLADVTLRDLMSRGRLAKTWKGWNDSQVALYDLIASRMKPQRRQDRQRDRVRAPRPEAALKLTSEVINGLFWPPAETSVQKLRALVARRQGRVTMRKHESRQARSKGQHTFARRASL